MRDFQDHLSTGTMAQSPEKERIITGARPILASDFEASTGPGRSEAGLAGADRMPAGGAATNGSLLNLQRQFGNRYVQRVVNLSLQAEGESTAPPEVQQSIESSRGGGNALDGAVGSQIGSALGADFGGVRVHTDGQADSLNRSLNAKAFTTGKDVFFRQGEYNPGTSAGKQLLVHELTHVVQQNPDVLQRQEDDATGSGGCACGGAGKLARKIQTQLTVGRPGDIYEQEADQMAQAFPAWEQRSSQTQDARGGIRRAMPEEEKKKEEAMVRTKPQEGALWRKPEDENKDDMAAIQTKSDGTEIRRQEGEEEPEG